MKRVLIVDDEKSFLLSLTDGLSLLNDEFSVCTAENGQEAIAVLNSTKIDLVVTDLKMPVMDGFALLAYLISHFPTVPAIVMTAFGTSVIEERIQGIGTFQYVEKPIDLSSLAERILNELHAQSRRHYQQVGLPAFLQLTETESKTCTIKITSKGRIGFLYFFEGDLLDAEAGTLKGRDAAVEIIRWEQPDIQIGSRCRRKEKLIDGSLRDILLESFQALDDDKRREETDRIGRIKDGTYSLQDLFPAKAEPGALPIVEGSLPTPTPKSQKEIDMSNVKECLSECLQIEGALAVALGDWKSGMCLGADGVNTAAYPISKLEVAVAGNTEVIRAKKNAAQSLGLNDSIEDILITLKTQYHMIRMVEAHPSLFFYLVLDRNKSNLAMARLKLAGIEQKITL